MNRRRFLTTASVTGIAGLAGCTGILGESNEEANPYNDPTEGPPQYLSENFQYHFTAAEGFNQVGGNVPDDAKEHQVVEPFPETSDKVDDWTEMLTNDHEKTRLALNEHRVPNPGKNKHLDGSVKEIVEKTGQLFNNWPDNEREFEQKYDKDIAGIATAQIEEIEDKAEKFTMALRGASAVVSGHNNSAAANYLNTNLAEYALRELDVDIPGYKVSTIWTAIDTIYEDEETPAEFDHPIGFLQYRDEDGNQRAKHFEFENSEWRSTYGHSARLDNSVYTAPLEQEFVNAGVVTTDYETNNFLSALDYERGRELQERGELSESLDIGMLEAVLSMIDDAREFYDYDDQTKSGGESKLPQGGVTTVISDSFGQSVSDYAVNPTVEKKGYLDGAARAVFSAMDKQGWNEPIALDGTIEDPEVFHATEDTIQEIHEDRAYDKVRQRVTAE